MRGVQGAAPQGYSGLQDEKDFCLKNKHCMEVQPCILCVRQVNCQKHCIAMKMGLTSMDPSALEFRLAHSEQRVQVTVGVMISPRKHG